MRILALVLLLTRPCLALAAQQSQPSSPPPLTIHEAVRRALDNYPAVRAALESLAAAQSGVDLARTTYLPRADTLVQWNRATRNNIFGMVLPQPVIPGISGPIGLNDWDSVWSNAIGLMVAWEPFDFGLRRANVHTAESTEQRAAASVTVTRLQVANAAADGFLVVVAAQQTLRTAEASVQRARTLRDSVEARVNAGLRPGVDLARARAELALAETQRLLAEQNLTAARIGLGHLVDIPPDAIVVSPGALLQPPAAEPAGIGPVPGTSGTSLMPAPVSPSQVAGHPVAEEQKAAIDEAAARLRALQLSWVPRFNAQGATFSRGSGAPSATTRLTGFGGLKPTVPNWALGLTVSFPIMDRPSLKARERTEFYRQRAETARYDRVVQDLSGQLERAGAFLASARLIAQNTPVQLDAARTVEQQATARYQAGLGTIVEVADAQRLLTQAEGDDSIAKVNIWRGLLQVAAAEGNLEPFLVRVQP